MRCPVAALVGALWLAGCYTYQPLASPQPRPGTRVSVDLNDSGSARLGEYLGLNSGVVEGRVLAVTDTAIELSVVSVHARDGQQAFWKGEPVTLPLSLIARVRQRRLAKGGTLLVGGALAAGALLAVDALTGGLFGSEKGGPPPVGQ